MRLLFINQVCRRHCENEDIYFDFPEAQRFRFQCKQNIDESYLPIYNVTRALQIYVHFVKDIN